MREEIDGALRRHRQNGEKQSVGEVLAGLTLDEWEAEFPVIQLCLKETTRLQVVGTSFRRNVSGKDVVLGSKGEVVPHGGFAVSFFSPVYFFLFFLLQFLVFFFLSFFFILSKNTTN